MVRSHNNSEKKMFSSSFWFSPNLLREGFRTPQLYGSRTSVTSFGTERQGVGLSPGFWNVSGASVGNGWKSKASPRVGSQPQNSRVQKGHFTGMETSTAERLLCPVMTSHFHSFTLEPHVHL